MFGFKKNMRKEKMKKNKKNRFKSINYFICYCKPISHIFHILYKD